MVTREELEIEIEQRAKILYKAIIFYRDAYYLNNPKTDEERTEADLKIQAIIKDLHGLRDKFYAHFDRNSEKNLSDFAPVFDDMEKMIKLSKKILEDISTNLHVSSPITENPKIRRAGDILSKLIRLRNCDYKEASNQFQ